MSKWLAWLVVLVLVLIPLMSRAATVAAQDGVDGTTYTSPNFNWSITWSDDWEVADVSSDQESDVLTLSDGLSTVYFESYDDFAGNAEDCVAEEMTDLESIDGFTEVEIGTDVGGDPLAGGDETNAYAVYTFTYLDEDDITTELVEYSECRTLVEGEAVLEISQITVRDAYNDAAPAVQNLIRGVTMPGEVPVEPADTSGDAATDDTADPAAMTPETVRAAAESSAANVFIFYEEAFADEDIFYSRPFLEIVEDESQAPCSEGAIHPGVGSFYCGLNQTIYFDLELEVRDAQTGGIASPYYTLGHEAGHDVQFQLGNITTETLSVETELEADCMAGAYLAWEADRGTVSEEDFFVLLDLVANLGDPEGTSVSDPNAHGLGSQRVAMVLRGYYNGIGACGTF